ncbi:MAG TPA: maleylpyruvate isomerase N-terminal domain-containing protein, partial [Acidimicrobiales bacterium]|nr:maleylpyruvate isomerase N-terminal domain-containing protein [Acidimicrobiales bacterium]
MTMTTSRDVTTIERIGHDEAMRLATVENAKFGALLRTIAPEDWSKPTDCELWDVRAMAAHVVGSAAGQASPREFLRQKRKGRPVTAEIGGQHWWDGMNEVQVRERAHLTPDELIAEWDSTSVRA